MNIFEYLDRLNKRTHQRRIIKYFDGKITTASILMLKDKSFGKDVKVWFDIIDEFEAKKEYYQNKLNNLL